jgi:hypothetical protein
MTIEQKRCPITNHLCLTPKSCNNQDSCDGEWLVHEIVKGYTAIVRLALAGKQEQAQSRLETDNLWIQTQYARNPIMDDVMVAAKKIITGS